MKKFLILLIILSCFLPINILALDKIDVNTAPLKQLEILTGIGPVKAQAIIDARPLSSIDDLDRAKGIGAATLQKIKDQGIACVNCVLSSTTPPVAPQLVPESPAPPATTPTVVYPSGIFLNEILPNPQGADETDEWIELYNSNSSNIDLSDWQIKDSTGTPTTYSISKNTNITTGGFLVFKRPTTKIMLNNDEDGLNLLSPDGKIIDSVTFTKSPLGQSYNKTNGVPYGSWSWSSTLTPGSKNILKTLPASATPKALQAGLSNTKNSVTNDGVELGLADLSQNMDLSQVGSTGHSPWFLFFTVLITTIILAIIVLIIKLKISKKYVRT